MPSALFTCQSFHAMGNAQSMFASAVHWAVLVEESLPFTTYRVHPEPLLAIVLPPPASQDQSKYREPHQIDPGCCDMTRYELIGTYYIDTTRERRQMPKVRRPTIPIDPYTTTCPPILPTSPPRRPPTRDLVLPFLPLPLLLPPSKV
jgi:hypothetical protein